MCRAKPFVAHQANLDPASPHGWWSYIRSCNERQPHHQNVFVNVLIEKGE